MSKKGMEMSVNVLVGIILGLIMFSAAIFIFFKIMGDSGKTADQLDEQTRQKMVQALDGGDPVYAPATNVKVIKNSAKFWIGIRNVEDAPYEFKMKVECLDTCPEGLDIGEIAYLPGPYNIAAKDNEFVSVVVNMKGVTQKATLLVTITKKNNDDSDYVSYWKPKIVTVQP